MKSIKRLRILLRPFFPQIFLAAVFLLLLTTIDMIFPAIIRQVIDIGITGGQRQFS